MGSCLSAEGAAALPYALGAAAVSASRSALDDVGTGIKRGNSRKKMRTDSSSLDSNMETWLHRVPGRLFFNGSSEVASLFSKKGKKGINQDAMIVWENFGSRTDTIFCGVFDGHGPCGHMVAKKVRDSLPLKLIAQLQINSIREHGHDNIRSSALKSLASEDIALMLADEEARTSNHKDSRPDFFMTMRGPFLKAFKVMDKELKLHPSIDCYCSGTTAVTLVKQRHDLIIANVGDSRAILGTRDEDDSLIAVQLTVDLKPDLPREAERIRRCKGRIFALQNEPEVARVWLPNCNSPGLAMARAFGDVCLKEFGLISVPDISYRRLTKKDEFVVLATDGIWDVLSNKEVVDIVASAPQSAAARAVVDLAVRAWKSKFPYGKVDDCAVVCLFLNSNSNHYSVFNSTQ
ncbi:probable protein phosphatase 2C 33 [Juglans microcarpa x Juglans regia]|uniref:probable protein phosphatase 2C 33 n=1 Tax=Juglans microcarpa x Juglans regia TaxID=2249226 RepID=UPI001B7E031D|nr:probable protein phosphatase 2C 33 [Juglans microcarpa x Juglans regia]